MLEAGELLCDEAPAGQKRCKHAEHLSALVPPPHPAPRRRRTYLGRRSPVWSDSYVWATVRVVRAWASREDCRWTTRIGSERTAIG